MSHVWYGCKWSEPETFFLRWSKIHGLTAEWMTIVGCLWSTKVNMTWPMNLYLFTSFYHCQRWLCRLLEIMEMTKLINILWSWGFFSLFFLAIKFESAMPMEIIVLWSSPGQYSCFDSWLSNCSHWLMCLHIDMCIFSVASI